MRLILVMIALAATMFLGIAAGVANSQCSRIIPVPATAGDIACVTSNGPSPRCDVPISASTCMVLIQTAFNQGLVTVDGRSWLIAFGWCPLVLDVGTGPRIIDFCPLR